MVPLASNVSIASNFVLMSEVDAVMSLKSIIMARFLLKSFAS